MSHLLPYTPILALPARSRTRSVGAFPGAHFSSAEALLLAEQRGSLPSANAQAVKRTRIPIYVRY
jgi:hypothetical protein